jgi:hypothetical protein
MRLAPLALLILAVAAGCAAPVADAESGAAADTAAQDANLPGWSALSTGIASRELGAGTAVLVVFGGYGARPVHAEAWADALVLARGEPLGLGAAYAVKGPRDALYQARELSTTALAGALAAREPERVLFVAHSSGSFVAHAALAALTPAVRAKTAYYDLDGGVDGLTSSLARGLGRLTFVWAHDPAVADNAGLSRNGSFLRAMAKGYPGAFALELDAAGSGCATKNCLHDTLINGRPHSPTTFDVADDYTDFATGGVTATYLDD